MNEYNWNSSFAGIRTLDNGKIDTKTAWRNEKEWKSVDVLIIDEISMIDAQYFDHMESIATEIRCFFEIAASRAPKEVIMKQLPAFGGIQVILCGDFLQVCILYKLLLQECLYLFINVFTLNSYHLLVNLSKMNMEKPFTKRRKCVLKPIVGKGL